MKLTSLIILGALVGGGAYLFIAKPAWFQNLLSKGEGLATGYVPAQTPTEAMDLFAKAIKNRKFSTAAQYVTGNYADQLKRGHEAAAEMGTVIDGIWEYAKNKGFDSDSAMVMLLKLDPFPPHFTVSGAPVKKGDTKAVGALKMDTLFYPNPNKINWGQFDPLVMTQPLLVQGLFNPGAEIQEVVDGDKKIWKLKVDVNNTQADALTYYMSKHKSYLSALTIFKRDATNNRHDTKEEFTSRLLEVIQKSK